MKKKWMAAALGAVAALGLTACSSADSPAPSASPTADSSAAALSAEEASAADQATLEQITWTDGDERPTLEFTGPLTMNSTALRMEAEGDGAQIEDGQNVILHYTTYLGTDGSELGSTYDGDAPETVSLVEGSVDPLLIENLVGAKVGTQFLYGAPNFQAGDGSAIFMAVTVTDATTPMEPLDGPTGEAVTPSADLPQVTLGEDGAPSIDESALTEVDELVIQPLIVGEGPEVGATSQITVNYTGWYRNDDADPVTAQFDSSWDGGEPVTFSMVGLIQGFAQGLTGQTVGSQVLLVIPPDLGYGDSDSATIPGGSTLYFVIDILAVN